MAKTKVIKTIVNIEDYQKLSAYAAIHGKKIWETLAEAIKEYNSRHVVNTGIAYPFNPSDPSEPPHSQVQATSGAVNTTLTLKDKVKIWLDTYSIHPKDHTMATFDKVKAKFEKVDIFMFDEIQHERAGD